MKAPIIRIDILSVALITLGIIVCIPCLAGIVILVAMPDSLGAFYIIDLTRAVSSLLDYPLSCGAGYIVFGTIAIRFYTKQDKGAAIEITGMAMLAAYMILLTIFIIMFAMPVNILAMIGPIIAAVCGALYIIAGHAIKSPRNNEHH